MGVTLERAWRICAYLDELERERCASDVRRAAAMTAPTYSSEAQESHARAMERLKATTT